jgi:hypothetical protein
MKKSVTKKADEKNGGRIFGSHASFPLWPSQACGAEYGFSVIAA